MPYRNKNGKIASKSAQRKKRNEQLHITKINSNARRGNGMFKQQATIRHQAVLDSVCCPKCKSLLVGTNAVRLQPRRKLSKKMQKLMCRKKENKESLTRHQQELLQKSLQCCNVLVLTCAACQWRGENKLRSREAFLQQKADLTHKTETQSQGVDADDSLIIPDRKMKKQMRRQKRRQIAAAAKALNLRPVSGSVNNSPADRLAQSESSGTFSVMASSTPSSTLPASPSLHAHAAAGRAGKTSMKPGPASPSLHAHAAAGRAGKTSMKPGPASPSIHVHAAAGRAGKTSMKPGPARPSIHAHAAAGRAGKTSMKPGPARPFRAQPGAQKGRVVKFGKQRQLQVMLKNTQNKGSLSAQESLLQFLNSLK